MLWLYTNSEANYTKKGVYFQAFTSLSTGFERICKLCYILIYAIKNSSQFPDATQMKNIFGHNILKIYEEIKKFKMEKDIQYTFKQEINDDIYQNNISNKKKEKIKKNAIIMNELLSDYVMVYHSGEDGNVIDNVYDSALQSGINDVVCLYRQQYIFHIIRYFSESVFSLEEIIRSQNMFEIPFFREIFGIFYNDDSYMKNRKTISI